VTKPDPAQRPNIVVWAYRCWLVAGGLLAALGVAYILLGIFVTVETLIPVGIGVLVAAVGVAYILLGSKTYTGDERWRSSLAALTLVVVIMLLVLSFLAPLLAVALLVAIIALFGSLLAYRPEADTWFTGKEPATTAPAKKGAQLKKRGKKTR
jgi:hypothetical protein